VANLQDLQAIEKSPYFTERLNEAQLAEARAEGIAIGADQLAKLIRDGHDVDMALKIKERGITTSRPPVAPRMGT
jgi:hypothetical protein